MFVYSWLYCKTTGGIIQDGVFGLFGFRDLGEKLCVSWALSLIECVAVWALKLPVPHTDALKTHSSQSFSPKLLQSK